MKSDARLANKGARNAGGRSIKPALHHDAAQAVLDDTTMESRGSGVECCGSPVETA
jgi:hypothetical protein